MIPGLALYNAATVVPSPATIEVTTSLVAIAYVGVNAEFAVMGLKLVSIVAVEMASGLKLGSLLVDRSEQSQIDIRIGRV